MVIALCGFMGCGKSSVGKLLSGRLSFRFEDLDSCIVRKSGLQVPEIFAGKGEAAFREMEEDTLREILSDTGTGNLILSLGGGTVTRDECAAMVREKTFCIYLKAGTDTLARNLGGDCSSRPMLERNGEKPAGRQELRSRIEELMAAREPVYENVASAVVITDGKSLSGIAEEITAVLYRYGILK